MHPEQNEIQPARGTPRDLFSAAFECDFLVGLRARLSSCADPRATSNQAGFRCSGPASAIFLVDPSLPQSASINPPPQKSDSLGDSLRHSEGKEIHIFYIHGIGSDGPNDYDSLALRSSICAYLRDCTSLAGTPIGEWDYADQGQFQPDATVPELEYMDEPVWKSADEWRAAAPYAIHFQLTRANGQNLYVDELNWWPLTFSPKCRQIIASDASFVAPSKARIETCSRR